MDIGEFINKFFWFEEFLAS